MGVSSLRRAASRGQRLIPTFPGSHPSLSVQVAPANPDCYCFCRREVRTKRIPPNWLWFFKPLAPWSRPPSTQRPAHREAPRQNAWAQGSMCQPTLAQARQRGQGTVNGKAWGPSPRRPTGEHTAHAPPNPKAQSRQQGLCTMAEVAFLPAGLQPGLDLEPCPLAPGTLTALAVALRDPERRTGRQWITGEIQPERGLFSLTPMFSKGAGTTSNVMSSLCHSKGWTREATEPNPPLPSSQRIPTVTPHSSTRGEGQLGLGR